MREAQRNETVERNEAIEEVGSARTEGGVERNTTNARAKAKARAAAEDALNAEGTDVGQSEHLQGTGVSASGRGGGAGGASLLETGADGGAAGDGREGQIDFHMAELLSMLRSLEKDKYFFTTQEQASSSQAATVPGAGREAQDRRREGTSLLEDAGGDDFTAVATAEIKQKAGASTVPLHGTDADVEQSESHHHDRDKRRISLTSADLAAKDPNVQGTPGAGAITAASVGTSGGAGSAGVPTTSAVESSVAGASVPDGAAARKEENLPTTDNSSTGAAPTAVVAALSAKHTNLNPK